MVLVTGAFSEVWHDLLSPGKPGGILVGCSLRVTADACVEKADYWGFSPLVIRVH